MADLKKAWDADNNRYDLVLDDDLSLALDAGAVKTAVINAILSWGRADESDPLPGFDGDLKGHWGDAYATRARGSLVWLLTGRIVTEQTLADAKAYLEAAVAGLIADGWLAEARAVVWRGEAPTTIAARLHLKLPDGRETSVEIDPTA